MNIKTKEPNLLIPAICLALASVTFWLYQPVLNHDFVNYDDPGYVKDNSHIAHGISAQSLSWAFSTGYASNWHPVTWISHMLDCQIFGPLNPGGHHLTNVIFHISNTVLLFLLLCRLTSAVWRAAVVAALFAWHPMHVESVAWIAERKDVLSTFFGLLTLLAYSGYGMNPVPESKSAKHYLRLAAFMFALALMSKPMMVTLPFVMLLLDFWPLKRLGRSFATASQEAAKENQQVAPAAKFLSWKELLREKTSFFAMTLFSAVITYIVQAHGHAVVPLAGMSPSIRVENAILGYAAYIRKMLWPANLAVLYPLKTDIPFANVAAAAAILVCVTALAWKFVRKAPYIAFGWFWFLGMLVPVIGIVQVGEQSFADRYSYLPFVGLFIAMTWGIFEWIGDNDSFKRLALSLVFLPVLAGCIVATSRQIPFWRNGETLFRHAIAVTTNNVTAYINLAVALDDAHREDEAGAVLMKADKLDVKAKKDATQNSLGIHYDKIGDTNNAEKFLLMAIAANPRFPSTHYNLGNVFSHEGRFQEAEEQYKIELQLDPDAQDVNENLGVVLLQENKLDEAQAQFKKVLRLNPESAAAHERLGETLRRQGQFSKALLEYEEAVRLNPEFVQARIQLGILLARNGELQSAIRQFQQALKVDLKNPDGWYNLAAAFEGLNQLDEAGQAFATVVRLRPGDSDARVRLAAIETKQGFFKEAVADYRAALNQNPELPVALQRLSWLLSSRPSADFHNPAEALELALKADKLTGHQSPAVLSSLDVAYGSLGKFDDAIKTAGELQKLAQANNLQPTADRAGARLELYKAGKPYRED